MKMNKNEEGSLDNHEIDSSGSEDDESSGQEPSNEYSKGGYCHLDMDEIINNKYKVIRKLGWGYFSTVWLCRDSEDPLYVAIKVSKSRTSINETFKDEIEFLKIISQMECSDNEGKSHVVQMLGYFFMNPLGKTHTCIVFEVLGKDILSLIKYYDYRGIPIPIVKRIMMHVLMGLDFLHQDCQIIHTDIKPENIVMSVSNKDIEDMVREREYYKELGCIPASLVSNCPVEQIKEYNNKTTGVKPSTFEMNRISDKFKNLAVQADSNGHRKDYHNDLPPKEFEKCLMRRTFKIIDMGNAMWRNDYTNAEISTREYRCPETIIGSTLNETSDIWAAACVAFELATGDYLFEPNFTETCSTDDIHLCQMEETLGPIPKALFHDGEQYAEFFTHEGLLLNSKPIPFCLLDVLFLKYRWNLDDSLDFTEFLLPMLNYSYERRLSAANALESPWLGMNINPTLI